MFRPSEVGWRFGAKEARANRIAARALQIRAPRRRRAEVGRNVTDQGARAARQDAGMAAGPRVGCRRGNAPPAGWPIGAPGPSASRGVPLGPVEAEGGRTCGGRPWRRVGPRVIRTVPATGMPGGRAARDLARSGGDRRNPGAQGPGRTERRGRAGSGRRRPRSNEPWLPPGKALGKPKRGKCREWSGFTLGDKFEPLSLYMYIPGLTKSLFSGIRIGTIRTRQSAWFTQKRRSSWFLSIRFVLVSLPLLSPF